MILVEDAENDSVARSWHETGILDTDHFARHWAATRWAGDSGGAPGGTRSPGRLLRRQLLYPAELQAPTRTLCPTQITYRTRLRLQPRRMAAYAALHDAE